MATKPEGTDTEIHERAIEAAESFSYTPEVTSWTLGGHDFAIFTWTKDRWSNLHEAERPSLYRRVGDIGFQTVQPI